MGEAGGPVLVMFVQVMALALTFCAAWGLFKALSR